MTKEIPDTIISDTTAIAPVSRIMEEGFHPKDSPPVPPKRTVHGSGQYAKTEFSGISHPSGEMTKTMDLFATMQSAFAKAENIHFEPRLWHGHRHSGEFSDFSIVVDGVHEKLPDGLGSVLQEESAGKPSRHIG